MVHALTDDENYQRSLGQKQQLDVEDNMQTPNVHT
ncbi:hypothetical protein SLEP1_g18885 [Rubroshorea leprosula]|uniref:Uncharacterized protein n=1 Tax=Rubroshorea leprosula TaxID=152421 RepID=A0AAV5J4Z8_9ROSI|nr:hypothetical protein SLEP1_g18885 [Rubroshorea leprosula]